MLCCCVVVVLLLLLEEGEEEGAVGAASLCMEYVSTLLILSPIVIVAVDPSFFMTVTRAPAPFQTAL